MKGGEREDPWSSVLVYLTWVAASIVVIQHAYWAHPGDCDVFGDRNGNLLIL